MDECQDYRFCNHIIDFIVSATILQYNFMLPELFSQENSIFNCIALLIVVLTANQIYRKMHSKKRLDAVRNRPASSIDEDQIIVAWELEDLFIDISDRKRLGYSKVDIEQKGVWLVIQKIKSLFGMGIFYKSKTSPKNMKNIMQLLADNPKVKLFLYTTLNLKIAEYILEKLCLSNFFIPINRRSCSDCYSEPLKHPTEVDYNTKRVIIVTGSKDDHLEEDSKYFLVVQPKEINSFAKKLNLIITLNSDIDDLHNQIGQYKARIEPDGLATY